MLELRDVTLAFGEKTVLQRCSLALGVGEHLALMGPSGCGKTTLLRCALGLQLPDSGTVTCDFQRTAAVFQEPRLLPWRNALDNVLAVTGKAQAARENALQWFEKLEIAEAAALYPEELSGGMQQRVSIARAMAAQPDFLVLDEPFKGLDEALRERVLALLNGSLKQTAVLLATHSEEEAAALGCRILRCRDGTFA